MRKFVLTAAVLALVLAGVARAEPVPYANLIPLINVPLPGWTAGEPAGTTVKSPMEASEASVEFAKGELRLEITVYDGGPAMAAAIAAVSQVEMETAEETVKPAGVKGYKGSLFTRPKEKEADLVIMVPPRFAVTIHSSGVVDQPLLQSAADQLDLAKLASMAK